MNDTLLLKVLSNAEDFEKYKPFIKDHTLSKYIKQLLSDFQVYFKDINKEITPEEFSTWFKHVRHVSMKPERMEAYQLIFDKWQVTVDTSEEEGTSDLENELVATYINLDYFTRIMDISMQGAEGKDVAMEDIASLLSDYEKDTSTSLVLDADAIDEREVTNDLEECADDTTAGDGLEWRLEELNVSCGPLRRGDFVELAAYVETGKTSFLASEATYMAAQLGPDDYVVWINNEQYGKRVRERLAMAACGITQGTIMMDRAKASKNMDKILGKEYRIRVMNDPDVTIKELNAFLDRIKPKLIIIDILDKVKGFEDSQRDDIRIQKLYQQGREWAKKYGPVITATQVNGSAADQKYIRMEQLAGSKVGKQGEADLIITIGKTHEDEDENKRYIHITKNKLLGGVRSLESERHGYWEVDIMPAVSRYKGQM